MTEGFLVRVSVMAAIADFMHDLILQVRGVQFRRAIQIPFIGFFGCLLGVDSAYAQVNNPYCLEKGGNQFCVPLQMSPWSYSSGITFDRADLRDWRAECKGRGGVLGDVDDNGVEDCTGAAEWTEENIFSMSRSVADAWFACGLSGNSSDTGWGRAPAGSGYENFCSDSRRFDSGIEVFSCRLLSFEGKDKGFGDLGGQYGCEYGKPYDAGFLSTRNKSLKCPPGYNFLYGSAGVKVGCSKEQEAVCPINNPVLMPRLAKVMTEEDFRRSGDGLKWVRHWNLESFYDSGVVPQVLG